MGSLIICVAFPREQRKKKDIRVEKLAWIKKAFYSRFNVSPSDIQPKNEFVVSYFDWLPQQWQI